MRDTVDGSDSTLGTRKAPPQKGPGVDPTPGPFSFVRGLPGGRQAANPPDWIDPRPGAPEGPLRSLKEQFTGGLGSLRTGPTKDSDAVFRQVQAWLRSQERRNDLVRLQRCHRTAPTEKVRCQGCGRWEEWRWCTCSHRSCPFGHQKYHQEKARELMARMGPAEHWWLVVVTTPPEYRDHHAGDKFRLRARELDGALERLMGRWRLVGKVQLHQSGSSDPWKPHPHYNLMISNRIWHWWRKQKRSVRKRTIPDHRLQEWTRRVILDLGWGDPERWHAWISWRASLRHRQWTAAYTIRSQGDGDPCARYHWQPHGMQLLHPIGMLGRGKRKALTWALANQWGDLQDDAVGSGWERALQSVSECCGADWKRGSEILDEALERERRDGNLCRL